jgi:hypothetical protein
VICFVQLHVCTFSDPCRDNRYNVGITAIMSTLKKMFSSYVSCLCCRAFVFHFRCLFLYQMFVSFDSNPTVATTEAGT